MALAKVEEYCQSGSTVTSRLAQDTNLASGDASKGLFGRIEQKAFDHKRPKNRIPSNEDTERARACGRWGPSKPSDTFLKIFHDVLLTIENDPLCGMVSPPLLGTCGTVPLTIIGPLLDICRHMSNCIARARKEVFLATNYWSHSDATTLITNSLRELSLRAGKRGERVVVKIMYDRGSPKQFVDNHQIVPENDYTGGAVKLPAKNEIPNIDMEVMNFHRPVFGTFHSKFMVVDREIAIVSSNNIQENDNVEMMVHLEGPVVDSFYDMCCISWHKRFVPALPFLAKPAADRPPPSFELQSHHDMFDEYGKLRAPTRAGSEHNLSNGKNSIELAPDNVMSPETSRTQETEQGVLNQLVHLGNAGRLPAHEANSPRYDPDIASEVLRAQSVLSPQQDESRMEAVTRHLNTLKNKDFKGSAPECDHGDEMATFIPLPKHEMVPMAMVCRKPWGAPNHSSLNVPQNAAFTGALRYAERDVFIQTPNLNAEPLIPEIIAAVKRGIMVNYYVCLGYNDAGELLPYQNGTNEMIAHRLYKQLNEPEKKLLNIYNYVGKDQIQPIHNKFKRRSCHIKLLIADGHIGIQGNGNQDTQSWFHSQEINVMIDSQSICAAWMEGIRRNQNTHIYGAVTKDGPDAGCWHDQNGKQAEGAIGVDPGKFSWARGIIGAVQRVRGAGGF